MLFLYYQHLTISLDRLGSDEMYSGKRKKSSITLPAAQQGSSSENKTTNKQQQASSLPSASSSEDIWLPMIKRRRRFTAEETKVLEKEYEKNCSPNQELIQAIANRISTPRKIVTTWFQNRRAKNKRKERRVGDRYGATDHYQPLYQTAAESEAAFIPHTENEAPFVFAPYHEMTSMRSFQNEAINYPNHCTFNSFPTSTPLDYTTTEYPYYFSPVADSAQFLQTPTTFLPSAIVCHDNSYGSTPMYELPTQSYAATLPLPTALSQFDDCAPLPNDQITFPAGVQRPYLINNSGIFPSHTTTSIVNQQQPLLEDDVHFNPCVSQALPSTIATSVATPAATSSTVVSELLTSNNTEYPLYVNPADILYNINKPSSVFTINTTVPKVTDKAHNVTFDP